MHQGLLQFANSRSILSGDEERQLPQTGDLAQPTFAVLVIQSLKEHVHPFTCSADNEMEVADLKGLERQCTDKVLAHPLVIVGFG